ncbi:11883_t:CDS:2 [Funneliformis mosseae]|uniref:11883_t:CDS:1 n=1 Tax=Funneliformis mosseae TaxID=27381 RepID=A0A9N9CA24_FUNMO|nr:11883_t:CDS:2 [Funneliformis mosseae]
MFYISKSFLLFISHKLKNTIQAYKKAVAEVNTETNEGDKTKVKKREVLLENIITKSSP